jgi:hypothetical protein
VNANQFALTNVRPGPHALTVVWTFDNNVPAQPPIMTTVRFTTQEASQAATAAPITPPSTGDGGVLRADPGGGRRSTITIALQLAVALGAAGVVGASRGRMRADPKLVRASIVRATLFRRRGTS